MSATVTSASARGSTLFPKLTRSDIDSTRTSSWIETFEDLSIPTRIINIQAIGEKAAFIEWFNSDSIFLPENSDRAPPRRQCDDEGEEEAPVYRLPNLNGAIRSAITHLGGRVFPKLNWTSPRDAAFILPQTDGGPLCCRSPADVYLLLKSSDFISHDLDPSRAYATGLDSTAIDGNGIDGMDDPASCGDGTELPLEIVLRRFKDINPSREFRCFVRDNVLLAISQRDTNYYDFLQSLDTQQTITETIRELWEEEIQLNFTGGTSYTFDVYLSNDLRNITLIDFNPYRPSTDTLLFTYEELLDIYTTSVFGTRNGAATEEVASVAGIPVFRAIESPAQPEATRNAPTFGENMMPLEVMEMSGGKGLDEFREAWEDAVARGMRDSSNED